MNTKKKAQIIDILLKASLLLKMKGQLNDNVL